MSQRRQRLGSLWGVEVGSGTVLEILSTTGARNQMEFWNPNWQVLVPHEAYGEGGSGVCLLMSSREVCPCTILIAHSQRLHTHKPHGLSDLLKDSGCHGYFWGQAPPSPELSQSVNPLAIPVKGLCSVP